MSTKYWEELSSVREENRNLTIDIENLKLQIGQWESKVKWKYIFYTLLAVVTK